MTDRVRVPVVAGTFYPGQADRLRSQLASFFPEGAPSSSAILPAAMGLIAPHAGYVYSGAVAAAGYAETAKRGRPEVAVILGANHSGFPPWIALAPFEAWATPLGDSTVDAEVTLRLTSEGIVKEEAPFLREHSIEVQLPFIQYLWGVDVPIVPLCVSPASLTRLHETARVLVAALDGRKALVVASSDFTHYRTDQTARQLDGRALERITALDAFGFLQLCQDEQLTICGTGAIAILMMMAAELGQTSTQVMAYATSGDVTGDLSSVVGYASLVLSKESHG